MSFITLQLSPRFLAHLQPLLETVSAGLRIQTAREFDAPENDPLLAETWLDGLLDTLREDCGELLELIRRGIARQGCIKIESGHAERVLRAASAVRLRLRVTRLKSLADESLETGDVDFNSLAPGVREAYACYVFLAGLQETLIDKLGAG